MPKNYHAILEKIQRNAYCPYSNFPVAVIVEIKHGEQLIHGANIENVAFGTTICAERVALTQAYTQGFNRKSITSIHLWSPTGVLPCGSCRQVMIELLSPDCILYVYKANTSTVKQYRNHELLPSAFQRIAETEA